MLIIFLGSADSLNIVLIWPRYTFNNPLDNSGQGFIQVFFKAGFEKKKPFFALLSFMLTLKAT